MLPCMDTVRIALAQIAPVLGGLEANLARHHELIGAAREALFLEPRTLLVSDRQGGTVWQVTLRD